MFLASLHQRLHGCCSKVLTVTCHHGRTSEVEALKKHDRICTVRFTMTSSHMRGVSRDELYDDIVYLRGANMNEIYNDVVIFLRIPKSNHQKFSRSF